MKNKILIELIVPDICEVYNIYIPINRKIGNVIELINKAVTELSNNSYIGRKKTGLYSKQTGVKYGIDELVRETDIKQGSKLILL